MTEPDSEDFQQLKKMEDDGYEHAKQLRREILRPVQRKTGRLMNKIANKASGQSFAEVPELVVKSEKGIESGRIVDGLEILYGELNNQANVLDEWRELVIQMLLRSLVDEEDNVETTGEELGDSAKIQDELMAYVTALRAVIADRQEAISGQPSELIKHETETAIKMAKEGEGPAPEKLLQLMEIRTQVKPKMAQMTMRGVIGEFRGIMSRLARDTHSSARETVERKIVSDQLKATQAQLNEQNKAALSLESEIEAFKTAMNARLDYYRQLQAVSDGVLPYEGPKTEHVIERLSKTEQDLKSRLSSAESKHRYCALPLLKILVTNATNLNV
jgi:E3 ubiquitin-protein ligase SHPRH